MTSFMFMFVDAGAALQHVDRELVGELAVLDVVACGDDEPCLVVVDQSELVVGFGTGTFDGRIGASAGDGWSPRFERR